MIVDVIIDRWIVMMIVSVGILVGLCCMILAGVIALTIYLCKIHRRSQRRKYLTDDEHYLILPAKKPLVRPPSYHHQQRSVGVATNNVSISQ